MVLQKNPRTGCIPWGYEILLRAAGVEGIDFSTFQDTFDFAEANNFRVVGDAVEKRYPEVRLGHRTFESGADKLAFVERRLSRGQPTLVSIALQGLDPDLRGWHVMPVVDASESALMLLVSVSADGNAKTLTLTKQRLVEIHDRYTGGNDVAYLGR